MYGNLRTLKEFTESSWIFSASTEKGPVTPTMVRGWIENLKGCEYDDVQYLEDMPTYTEKMIPQRPVLKTTSMVPQVALVNVYKSLAKVIPGKMLVKKR